MIDTIVTVKKKKEEKFLRRPVADFDFKNTTKKEIRELVKRMRKAMKEANGVGLSANQIGLEIRAFVAQDGNKFYAVFNPEMIKASKEKIDYVEGCLSVPKKYGSVSRPEKITLIGFDQNGKKLKIKAWGFLARVFQHEIDHLNGVLFTDKISKK